MPRQTIAGLEASPPSREELDKVSGFSSRQASPAAPPEQQLNLRLPADQARRFRALAREERYKLGAFLCVLMDAYENNRSS